MTSSLALAVGLPSRVEDPGRPMSGQAGGPSNHFFTPEDGRAYVGYLSSQLATGFVFAIPSRVSLLVLCQTFSELSLIYTPA